ncbi:MAG TPA: hypothetical protein VNA28_01265 [Solirubrobacteraceae bacterium]|nr:hypothetical protein [Solirubrobacteraceae bacterium]
MGTGTYTTRRAIAIAAAIALLFAGCGGSDDSNDLNTPESAVQRNIESAQAEVKAAPDKPEPQAALAKAYFQSAGVKTNDKGEYSDAGKDDLRRATKAWERYVSLDPDPLDTGVAQLIAAAYGPGSLDEPKQAVEVQQVLAENISPPRASQFTQLAQMAYSAGEVDIGDKARKRALELLPKRARPATRKRLKQARDLAPAQSQP